LRTPHLSLGPKLTAFEDAFAAYCGTAHAVACSSGTAALHTVLTAWNLGPGDEVVTTPFSFIASSNAILMTGAKPVFADIDPRTWNIDPAEVERAITPRTRALLPVDVFGVPAPLDALRDIARSRNLLILEDACEALGSAYQGRRCGSLGDAGVFGFYPNKQITTGEGGMIVTDDESLARRCRSLRNQGRDEDGDWLTHTRLGYNYRLGEMQCALGLAQLARIDEILAARGRVYQWYRQRLADERRLQWQEAEPDATISRFVLVVRLRDEYDRTDRDRILAALRERGIGCSNYFAPIHLQPFYAERFGYRPGSFPRCEALAARTIALPFHHELTQRDVDRVCGELQRLLGPTP
ncbi:MAG: DegT/DnrJ/EryC1/StrS family aminotransferase, partial [Planctomycetota bacterium]